MNKKSLVTLYIKKKKSFHDWSKHINTKYHFIRECIIKKKVQLKFEISQDQIMDIFTKPLKFEDFKGLRMLIGGKIQV